MTLSDPILQASDDVHISVRKPRTPKDKNINLSALHVHLATIPKDKNINLSALHVHLATIKTLEEILEILEEIPKVLEEILEVLEALEVLD